MSPNNLRVLCFVGAALFTFAGSVQAQEQLPGIQGVKYVTHNSTGTYKAELKIERGTDVQASEFKYNFSGTIGSSRYRWNSRLKAYEPQRDIFEFHYIRFRKISPGIYEYRIINSVTGQQLESGSCLLQL